MRRDSITPLSALGEAEDEARIADLEIRLERQREYFERRRIALEQQLELAEKVIAELIQQYQELQGLKE